MQEEGAIKVGITCGDVNGIGLEVVMKTFLDNRMHQVCTPVIYASSKLISHQRKQLNLSEFNYQTIKSSNDIILKKNNVVNCWDDEVNVEWGKQTEASGKYALLSIEAAIKDLQENKIHALVTAPINKHAMPQGEFAFKGHTEYLASKFNTQDYLMFLVSESLRIAVVTGHVPLQEASKHITEEKIISRLKLMNKTLKRDFGIRKPRIAVLGINPHAGDNGLIGKEEQEIIIPAITKASEENVFVYGPYSADGFFGAGTYTKFDAVLAMYHDQGLIPFKSIAFSSGVNFTAGLPVVRTSPDHGTAYDIAGKNLASESSIREAIYLACDITQRRQGFDEVNSNPLPFTRKVREYHER
jgi:4-hydroxythreonine-4-phosphate dehydrogenase